MTPQGKKSIVCLIPVLGRHNLLHLNVEALKQQTQPLKAIVLIVSNEADKKFAIDHGVDWVHSPNQPLGLKYQTGIKYCQKYQPDGILINGSDDFLSLNWSEKLSPLLDEYDIIGTSRWYIIDTPSKKNYALNYVRPATLGAGRLISSRILDKLKWNLYPKDKKESLDSASMANIRKVKGLCYVYQTKDIFVISLKGEQKVMNSTSRIIKNLGIRKRETENIFLKQLSQYFKQSKIQSCLQTLKEQTISAEADHQ